MVPAGPCRPPPTPPRPRHSPVGPCRRPAPHRDHRTASPPAPHTLTGSECTTSQVGRNRLSRHGPRSGVAPGCTARTTVSVGVPSGGSVSPTNRAAPSVAAHAGPPSHAAIRCMGIGRSRTHTSTYLGQRRRAGSYRPLRRHYRPRRHRWPRRPRGCVRAAPRAAARHLVGGRSSPHSAAFLVGEEDAYSRTAQGDMAAGGTGGHRSQVQRKSVRVV
jgi:hypothetical protein